MNKYVKNLQEIYNKNPDFIIKKIRRNFNYIYIIYLESICSSNKINDYILKTLSLIKGINKSFNSLESIIPGPHLIKLDNDKKLDFYLQNGFALIIYQNQLYAVEVRADLSRAISHPLVEQSLFGPKDSFTESIQVNLGLIKRHIKDQSLKSQTFFIGKITKTMINLLYIKGSIKEEVLNSIINKINSIISSKESSSLSIENYFEENNKTHFPTVLKTERPDRASISLLEGKAVILIDTSPFALILPSFLIDFINPITDIYNTSKNINIIKFIRLISFFLTVSIPSIYISLIDYNPESIPTPLLINFLSQRKDVPFPSIVEAFLMLFIYEVLKESDIRFPNTYGSAISILGALILGEASVKAGFVSPIMIIVIALTFITSLIFTEEELTHALRFYRLLFLISSALYGLYGVVLAFIFLSLTLTNLYSLNYHYLFPIIPYSKNYFNITFIKSSKIHIRNIFKRSSK